MSDDMTCSIESCIRPVKARGWCNSHHLRWQRHGDPLAGGPLRYATPEESFAVRTKRVGECLIWTGAKIRFGYGTITAGKRRSYLAHRYAWERINGPIPEGMTIDHICHTPSCVEVSHLRLATRGENNFNLSGPHSGRKHKLPRGVYPNRKGYTARATHQGRTYCLGTYSTPQEAAEVAEAKRRELFGEFAGKGRR